MVLAKSDEAVDAGCAFRFKATAPRRLARPARRLGNGQPQHQLTIQTDVTMNEIVQLSRNLAAFRLEPAQYFLRDKRQARTTADRRFSELF